MMGTFKIFPFGVFVEEKGKNRNQSEKPGEDDQCPICFGDFTIPCRTNCGHWFCATCILQLWNYKSTVQRCKCPICCRPISKLVPEDTLLVRQQEDSELLRDIGRYNHLYVGGVYGVFLLLLSWIYSRCNFEFIPTGRLGIWRLLDICAMSMVAVFYFAGLFRRWVLRRHVRLLPVLQAHPS
ncbi:uncharacterized protein LOC132622172 isoform X2 [Lycium barbarum]|uniref:uncharacterized protein LOC132622172 isoform X2 n=1 Tax=Lycium barbarum TaxID=112863 RepID=UPI00293F0A4F|nr:uncharacterized protein LOC132622172 isoform X2 [Lycium barbarum]